MIEELDGNVLLPVNYLNPVNILFKNVTKNIFDVVTNVNKL